MKAESSTHFDVREMTKPLVYKAPYVPDEDKDEPARTFVITPPVTTPAHAAPAGSSSQTTSSDDVLMKSLEKFYSRMERSFTELFDILRRRIAAEHKDVVRSFRDMMFSESKFDLDDFMLKFGAKFNSAVEDGMKILHDKLADDRKSLVRGLHSVISNMPNPKKFLDEHMEFICRSIDTKFVLCAKTLDERLLVEKRKFLEDFGSEILCDPSPSEDYSLVNDDYGYTRVEDYGHSTPLGKKSFREMLSELEGEGEAGDL